MDQALRSCAAGSVMQTMMPFFRAIRLLRSFGVGLELGRRGDLALFASGCPGEIREYCGLS